MSLLISKITSLPSLFNKNCCYTLLKVSSVSTKNYGTETAVKTWQHPYALYGGRHTVSLLSGDGIGPEMMKYVKEIFKVARVPVDFEDVKLDKINNTEEDFHKALLSIKRNGVALKGSIESQYADVQFVKSRNATLRVELDLFANLLHCQSYKGVNNRFDLDLVVIRQNTEGEYAMIEHEAVPGVVECIKVITRSTTERLGRFAFDYACRNGRKKITCIHKANIQKLTDGLFLETLEEVSKDYPDIEFNNMIVDNTCMQLVAKPEQFDVMVAPNLYGLVIQNVICGLAGGAGLFSGHNYGAKCAVFEPGTRNIGATLGTNVGNPVATLVAACDMLKHLGLVTYSDVIQEAIRHTLEVDRIHTRDLGGEASTSDVVQNVVSHIIMLEEKRRLNRAAGVTA